MVRPAYGRRKRAKFDLDVILRTLVMSRVLFPCSKSRTLAASKQMIEVPDISESRIYKALSLLSSHIDDLQSLVWENSGKIMERNTRVIFYDCTNYYFKIEDNDHDYIDTETGEVLMGLRKRGKSKEHRPNHIVQMGLLMDGDGIPLSFIIFPGNESEQPSLKRIEEMVADKFGLNEFIISTDAGLGSEDNRRYNMTEGREYITVQSLPALSKKDQDMALDPRGWRVASRDKKLPPIDPEHPDRDIFNLSELDLEQERHTRFYKEIMVEKRLDGKESAKRAERVIVTYSHDFALYLQAKREVRVGVAKKIIKNRHTKSPQTQQHPRRYIEMDYITKDGKKANKVLMSLDNEAIEKEKRFDGFYAYGTSLDDDAVDVLRARSFHHEFPKETPTISHEYEIRERTSGKTLTDKLRMLFYSLRHVPKEWDDCKNNLERPLFLIKNMDKMDKNSTPYKIGGYEDMFDAAESTLIVGEDAVLYSQSLDRLINSQAAVDYSREQGLKEGRKEGIISVAVRMKQQGLSNDMIASFTGLDSETIKDL